MVVPESSIDTFEQQIKELIRQWQELGSRTGSTSRIVLHVEVECGISYCPGIYFGGTPDPAALCVAQFTHPGIDEAGRDIRCASHPLNQYIREVVGGALENHFGIVSDRFSVQFEVISRSMLPPVKSRDKEVEY